MMRRSVLRLVLAGMLLTLIPVVGGAAAQEPVATAHPSHVHAGTCAALDPNPAYPLADVAPVSPDAAADAVETGTTTIEPTLDDLLATPYAINVHASAGDIATYIACGDIAGPVVDDQLIIPLRQQNESGYSGVAVLTATDAGTAIAVYLGFGLDGSAAATAAAGVAVSIVDFGFEAESVEVPVGTTVTWTNDGDVIHTTTSRDGLWDSAIMNPGDTFSYTFDETGTYEYLCTLHPNMVGEIVVTGA
jgi:plastocyanin